MSREHDGARASLAHEGGFRFHVSFDGNGMPAIHTDEPRPLGEGRGPNPTALLAAAVGNCLASSLLFCLRKARLEVQGLEAEVRASTTRNEAGRLRIGEIDVRLAPTVTPEVREKMGRCLDLFESFCVVTESVRHGIEVKVAVEPRLKPGEVVPLAPLPRPPCAVAKTA